MTSLETDFDRLPTDDDVMCALAGELNPTYGCRTVVPTGSACT
jgi:hypothetical protein